MKMNFESQEQTKQLVDELELIAETAKTGTKRNTSAY